MCAQEICAIVVLLYMFRTLQSKGWSLKQHVPTPRSVPTRRAHVQRSGPTRQHARAITHVPLQLVCTSDVGRVIPGGNVQQFFQDGWVSHEFIRTFPCAQLVLAMGSLLQYMQELHDPGQALCAARCDAMFLWSSNTSISMCNNSLCS